MTTIPVTDLVRISATREGGSGFVSDLMGSTAVSCPNRPLMDTGTMAKRGIGRASFPRETRCSHISAVVRRGWNLR